ncbi:MAG: hypothetical protein HN348_05315 [Proteobacteria bacterium]|jgi:hypothetical protein|nr:hypothetical protein [Pseudomonadota bacterium]
MQQELETERPDLTFQLIGINQTGYDSGNDEMVTGRDLPFLQDNAKVDVWHLWNVTYRDVVILDEDNLYVESYNLSLYPLSNATYYAELKQKLIEAADSP